MSSLGHIVLLSKDATLPEYFGVYGGVYKSTPNIDALAKKGTVFYNHYSAAPSTAMAFLAMFTGLFPYQTEYARYAEVGEFKGETLFDRLYDKGYECHLLWSSNYVDKAEKYSKCYGRHTIHHDQYKFNQSCGFNAEMKAEMRKPDEALAEGTLQKLIEEVDTIDYQNKPIFLWIHMPHCLLGRVSYGDDIDLFDRLVGEMRKRFADDNLFVTADHGHMNGTKGKAGYGFDVYRKAARIPLIAPRINGCAEITFPTSNIQLGEMILEHKVTRLPYVLCDSQFYAQPYRKLAVIKDHFYYIYNKADKTEELYDIQLDPNQEINLLASFFWKDRDRHCETDIRQVIYYPFWEDVEKNANELREIKNGIWKTGTRREERRAKRRAVKVGLIYWVKGILRKLPFRGKK